MLADWRGFDADMMVSEFLGGGDDCALNYNSYYVNGTPVAEFMAQKLRLRPTMIGFPTADCEPQAAGGRRVWASDDRRLEKQVQEHGVQARCPRQCL